MAERRHAEEDSVCSERNLSRARSQAGVRGKPICLTLHDLPVQSVCAMFAQQTRASDDQGPARGFLIYVARRARLFGVEFGVQAIDLFSDAKGDVDVLVEASQEFLDTDTDANWFLHKMRDALDSAY